MINSNIEIAKKIPANINTYFMYGQFTKLPIEPIIANCNPIEKAIFTFFVMIYALFYRIILPTIVITQPVLSEFHNDLNQTSVVNNIWH